MNVSNLCMMFQEYTMLKYNGNSDHMQLHISVKMLHRFKYQ